MVASVEVTPYGLSRPQLALECIRLALRTLNPPAMVYEAGRGLLEQNRAVDENVPLPVLVGGLSGLAAVFIALESALELLVKEHQS